MIKGRYVISVSFVAVLAGTALTVAATPAAAVTVRFASPGGSGSACTSNDPCGIVTAVNDAPADAEVQIGQGTYGSPSHPLTTLLTATEGQNIHGNLSLPMPNIYDKATETFSVDNATLSWVHVHSSGNGAAIAGTSVNHVIANASGSDSTACEVVGVLSDSVCIDTGSIGAAVWVDDSSNTTFVTNPVVRNVTAVATQSTSQGLLEQANQNTTINLTATDVIFKGGDADLFVQSLASTGHANLAIDHSDFDPAREDINAPTGTAVVTPGAGNVSAPPVFVKPSALNYKERAASPTVDAGAPDPADTVDVIHDPRLLGAATDIGGYEFEPAPAVKHVTVSKRKKHGFKVTAKVNGEGLISAAKVEVKPGHASTGYEPLPGSPSSRRSHVLTFKLHRLKAHHTYRLRVLAKNIGGTTRSKLIKVKTK